MDLEYEQDSNLTPPKDNDNEEYEEKTKNSEDFIDDYPYKLIWKYFGHYRREFRFQDYNNNWLKLIFYSEIDFFENIKRIYPKCIHIGGIHSIKSYANNKLNEIDQRELTFDIDITSYQGRICCKNNVKPCEKCYYLILRAYEIINKIITEHFDFKNFIWVFSGKKGIHCWIFDENVLKLKENERSNILTYFEQYKLFYFGMLTQYDKEKLIDIFGDNLSDIDYINLFWLKFDRNVTIGISHFLKSPYVNHTETGKRCVIFENTLELKCALLK